MALTQVNKMMPNSTNRVTLCAPASPRMIIFVQFCVNEWILAKLNFLIEKVKLGWVKMFGKARHSLKRTQ